MTAAIGYYSLIGALFVSLAHTASLMPRIPQLITSRQSAHIVLLLITIAFGALITAFASSDFSVLLVYQHSFSLKPMLYKITGTWGNHEGSMLLFALIFVGYTALYALTSRSKQRDVVLSSQLGILTLLLIYLCFFSSPFVSLVPAAPEGQGLNPLLQDIGLAIHPPILYLGYGCTSLLFSHGVMALLKPKTKWFNEVQPWLYASWMFLTAGITLGAWWAYRELGWGGYWFWDPVENASLLPWLVVTSLMHSLRATSVRGALARWSVVLALLAFLVSLLGFFLVRSGILSSVHSFASDPTRGVIMLLIVAIVGGTGFGLFATKSDNLSSKPINSLIAREGHMLWQNLLLSTLLFIVLLGILYPILSEVLAQQAVAVGTPYFIATFMPISVLIVAMAVVGTGMPWKTIRKKDKRISRIWLMGIPPLGAALYSGFGWLTAFGLAVGVVLLIHTIRLAYKPVKNAHHNAMVLGHLGLALLTISLSLNNQFNADTERWMRVGDSTDIAGYTVTLTKREGYAGENYLARKAVFKLYRRNDVLATLTPETRIYIPGGQETTESDYYATPLHDIMVATGVVDDAHGLAVRIYYRPYMQLIWLSVVLLIASALTHIVRRKT